MGDNKSLEPFFNDDVSDADGVKRNLRVTNALNALEGYQISDREAGATSYFGFLNKDGAWYIQKEVQAGAEVNTTYASGTSGYATAWTNRATQSYQRFNDEF